MEILVQVRWKYWRTGTAAPARDQKLRRPQILGSNVQNNSSFRYKDAVTSFFRSRQVRCSRRFNFQYLKSALKELGAERALATR
jgi:hypothetical protein